MNDHPVTHARNPVAPEAFTGVVSVVARVLC